MREGDSFLDENGDETPVPADEVLRSVPETGKVPKRPYNLSDAAIAARRANAKKSTGPATADGKAASSHNSWKHGLHARATAVGLIGKPCTRTCHKYPCTLIDDGEVQPGRHCLDKEFFLDALQKIQLAIQEKQFDGVNEIYGHVLAKNLAILADLQGRLLSEGPLVKNAKMDKEGILIGWETAINPAMAVLPKLLTALNISFGDALLTPAAIAKHKAENDDKGKKNTMDVMAEAINNLSRLKNSQP